MPPKSIIHAKISPTYKSKMEWLSFTKTHTTIYPISMPKFDLRPQGQHPYPTQTGYHSPKFIPQHVPNLRRNFTLNQKKKTCVNQPNRHLRAHASQSTPYQHHVLNYKGQTNKFPYTTRNEKTIKYNPIIQALRTTSWLINPLITITTCVRGAIHWQPIKDLGKKIKISKNEIKTLMKQLHHNAIKYLAYLILNLKNLDNKQTPGDPPSHMLGSMLFKTKRNPPSKREEVPLLWHLIEHDYGTNKRTPIHVGA